MKFHCERCKTKYSIADEKVRGKILKIRCKNCSSVITVKEGMELAGRSAADAAAAVSAASISAPASNSAPANGKGHGPANAKSPVLEEAFNRAMSRLPTPSPAAMLPSADDDEDEDRTRIGEAPMPPEPVVDEWFVSVEGAQEGPFTLAEAQRRVGRKLPTEDMFSWHDGFDDWLPVGKVPELAAHVPKPAVRKPSRQVKAVSAPGPAAAPPPMPLGPPPSAGLGARGGLAASAVTSSVTSSPARVPLFAEKAPQKAAPAKRSPFDDEAAGDDRGDNPSEEGMSLSALAANAPGNEAPSDDAGMDFDIGEASRVIRLPELGKMMSSATAAKVGSRSGASPAARLQAGNGAGMAAATAAPTAVLDADANASAAILMPLPRRSRKRAGWLLAGGGGLLAVIVVVLLVIVFGQSSATKTAQTGPDRESTFVEGFYSEGGGINTFRPQGGSPDDPKKPDDPVADPDPVRKGTLRPIKKPIGTQDPGKTGPVIVRPVEDPIEDEPDGSGEALDASEVVDMYGRNKGIIGRCFDQELKMNPDFKPGRLQVTITIAASGTVTAVDLPATGSAKFNDCVTKSIRSWRFRKSAGGLKTAITLSFQTR